MLPTLNAFEYQMCGRKIGYVTKREAQAALKQVQRSGGGRRLKSFRCPHCGFYHLGKSDRRLQKNQERP